MHNAHVSMPSNNLRRKIPKWSEIINRGSMSVSLSKNQSVSLSKQAPNGLSAITLGVGWDVAKPKDSLARFLAVATTALTSMPRRFC
jgi:hypothetical protein